MHRVCQSQKGDNNLMKTTGKYWISLLSLGYMGGTIYLLPYVKYSFYTQMMDYIGCSNTQLGFMLTVFSLVSAIGMIPGGMVADKFDCRKIIILSVGATTLITFLHAVTAHSYMLGLVSWGLMGISTGFAYWPGLQKYITSLGPNSASNYGRYYLVNGLSGALGNFIPIWVLKQFNAQYPAVVWTMGIMTLIATVLCVLFLESEDDMIARGVVFEEEEPVRLSDIKYVLTWPGTYMFFFSEVGLYTLYAQISFLTPYLVDVMGIDPEASSIYSTIRTYCSMLLAPVGGWLAGTVFKSTAKYSAISGVIIALMVAGIFMFNPDSNVTLVSIYTLIPSIIIMPVYAVKFSIIGECHIPQAIMGTTIGVVALIPTVDGLEPVLFGHWLDKHGNGGYTYILWFLVISGVIVTLNAFWILSHDKKCKAGLRVPRGGIAKAAEDAE